MVLPKWILMKWKEGLVSFGLSASAAGILYYYVRNHRSFYLPTYKGKSALYSARTQRLPEGVDAWKY